MQNRYKYQRLDTPSSFRLLRIEQPDDTNPLCHYSLIQTTLDQARPYEALSYVWGKGGRSETLKLKDGKLLSITELLKEALPSVERQRSTEYLWIDQICIDQDDRIERVHQVKLMGQIYTSCSRVLVWLGRVTKFDDELSLADNLVQSQSSKNSIMKSFIHRLRNVTGSGGTSGILQSEWFQRAWVFQEVVLPPSALFILATMSAHPHQAHTISFSELYANVNLQAMNIDGADEVVKTIRIMYRRYSEQRRKNGPHSPIEHTLSLLAPQAKTSEQLDQLYAFFGLNFDTCINLTPSYESSLEVAMVNTATSIIEGTCSLDLFEVIPRAVENTVNNVRIPTWTPDFREEHLVVPFKRSNFDFRQLAKSSPKLCPLFIPAHITFYRGTVFCAGEEKRMIEAHGFVLDHVDTKIGTLPSRTTLGTGIDIHLNVLLKHSTKAWNEIKRSVEHKDSSMPRYKHKSARLAEFTADLGFAPPPTMGGLRRALAAEGYCALNYEHLLSESTENVSSKERTMMQVMGGRTLWMTRSGRFALGSYLHSGDHICLAYGCSNPIALRGEHEMTKVLGTCFLEGWMDPWSNRNIERAEKSFACTVFYII